MGEERTSGFVNPGGHVDAVVAFGYGPVLAGRMPGVGRLNAYGRVSALAAGMVARHFHIPRIIMTGARTGGPHLPSEAELMRGIAMMWAGVPDDTVVLEEQATNTILNVVYVANIVDRMPAAHRHLVFIAMGCHLPRIKEMCSIVGFH